MPDASFKARINPHGDKGSCEQQRASLELLSCSPSPILRRKLRNQSKTRRRRWKHRRIGMLPQHPAASAAPGRGAGLGRGRGWRKSPQRPPAAPSGSLPAGALLGPRARCGEGGPGPGEPPGAPISGGGGGGVPRGPGRAGPAAWPPGRARPAAPASPCAAPSRSRRP